MAKSILIAIILAIIIILIVILILKTMQITRYKNLISDNNCSSGFRRTEVLVSAYSILPKASQDRTVITMTSIPERLNYLRPVLNSLLDQTVKVDEISLNIPLVSRKGVKYEIPTWLHNMETRESSPVKIYRMDLDEGPGSKILPTLRRERSDTLVIAVDDDNIYSSKMVEGLINEYYKHGKKCAITNYGMVMKSGLRFPFKYDRAMKILSGSREVDFVQGCSGFLLNPWMIPKEGLDIKNGPKEALTVDDIWISGWLHVKKIRIMQPGMNIRYVPLPHVSALKNTPSLIWTENSDRKNDLTTIEWFRQKKGMKLMYEK
jgi:hypothetical protein